LGSSSVLRRPIETTPFGRNGLSRIDNAEELQELSD